MFRIPSSLRFIGGASKQIFTSNGKLLIGSFATCKRVQIKFCKFVFALRAAKLVRCLLHVSCNIKLEFIFCSQVEPWIKCGIFVVFECCVKVEYELRIKRDSDCFPQHKLSFNFRSTV